MEINADLAFSVAAIADKLQQIWTSLYKLSKCFFDIQLFYKL